MLKRQKNIEHLLKIYSGIITVLFSIFFALYCMEYTEYNIDTITEQVSEEDKTVSSSNKNNLLYKKLKNISEKTNDFWVENRQESVIITIKGEKLFYQDTTQFKENSLQILNNIFKVVKQEKKNISSIVVLSHSMQKDDNIPNEAVSDRILTATRSAKISAYIQQKKIIEPQNILSIGCGQFSPLIKNGSADVRKKNERIEIKIQKNYRQE